LRRFVDVASARYKTGLDPYLNVFTAQAILLANQQTVIMLRVQQMTSSVQLIESLGGGWNVTQLPTEQQVQAKRP
jgi:outer membrane protein TolC